MSVTEMIREARKLPLGELRVLARELDEELARRVDEQFEKAIEAGAFDHLAKEAEEEYRAGKTRPLDGRVLGYERKI
jgi:predicted solute-binding protein